MADYDRFIGGNTTLRIRDTGGWVEFWVRTGSQTFNYDQQWSYFANGAESGTRKARMVAGGNWQHFGSVHVAYDQDVRFTIYNAGLGFPTYDFWQRIPRSTVPQPPHLNSAVGISASHIRVQFVGQHDGGSPVVEWQIGYGGNPNAPEAYWGSPGISDVGPFASGQRVYFWARGRNAVGWSGWSNRGEASTWRVPDSPQPTIFTDLTQTSVRTVSSDRYDGGTPIIERELGYGQNPSVPEFFVMPDGAGVNNLPNLDPGKTYYFWGRVRNSIGWSTQSARTQVSLIAGARVLVNNQWERAVPYVKHAGVWKVARPWIRDAGVWKESAQ
jgi:hypothetical protein